MGKLFYIIGKSAVGKDTLYKKLQTAFPTLRSVIMYTTRPRREGEEDGKEYFFVSLEKLNENKEKGEVIELRTYQTIHGPWNYFTLNDGQINLEENSYLLMGTLESYEAMRDYYGQEVMCPIYIEVENGERLSRALQRERQQETPKYEELCRRFLADAADFSAERLEKAGINQIFNNLDGDTCFQEICVYIKEKLCYNKKES